MLFRLEFHTMPHRRGHLVDLLVPMLRPARTAAGELTTETCSRVVACAYPRVALQHMPVLYDVHDIANGGTAAESVTESQMLEIMHDLGKKHGC
jgi:hypothetical protein